MQARLKLRAWDSFVVVRADYQPGYPPVKHDRP